MKKLILSITKNNKKLLDALSTLLLTLFAGIIRFISLGDPKTLVFDETYYVKDALTLAKTGFEHSWASNANALFNNGSVFSWLNLPEFAVHPPLGKYMIWIGMQLFSPTSTFGWRFSSFLFGTLSVFIMIRFAKRLFKGSMLAGILAGFLLAIDGVAIVLSRTGILDIFLMFWTLLGAYLIIVDKDYMDSANFAGKISAICRFRIFRFLAIIAFSLSFCVKWSGIYFLVFFMLLSLLFDLRRNKNYIKNLAIYSSLSENNTPFNRKNIRINRQNAQKRHPNTFIRFFIKKAIPLGVLSIFTLISIYLLSFIRWFTSIDAYARNFPTGSKMSWLIDSLNSFWLFQKSIYDFHTHLTSHHQYSSRPFLWIFQGRPTSFYYQTTGTGVSDRTQSILCLGNPLIWWLGTVSLLILLVIFIKNIILRKHTESAVQLILVGFLASWGIWFLYPNRTIFNFYAVAMLPYVVLSVVYVANYAVRLGETAGFVVLHSLQRNTFWLKVAYFAFIAVVIIIFVVSIYFYPIWTAKDISYTEWHNRMWFKSWI